MPATPVYLHLEPGAPLPDSLFADPYRAVIAAEASVNARWRATVAEWLVRTGCLYTMAWGPEGSAWDTAVDEANIEAHAFGDIPPDRFVMTTWHDEEPLEEVFWFCKNNAHHPAVQLRRTLLLHIARVSSVAEFLRGYDEA